VSEALDRLWDADASTLAHAVKRLPVAWLASVAAVGIGIMLRLLEFFKSRSLSQDEAQLALNIMNRSFDRLFGQLDFNQAAPQGFLALQKTMVEAIGESEYSLRLLPFLAGTLALVLLPFLARGGRERSGRAARRRALRAFRSADLLHHLEQAVRVRRPHRHGCLVGRVSLWRPSLRGVRSVGVRRLRSSGDLAIA
jgi:hypothetical protein